MLRRGAAAAADDVHQTGVGEFREQRRHELGRLVVASKFVRQPGIRIGTDQRIGDTPDLGDVSAHFLGAERAVEPDRKRRGMLYRIPERRRRLPGQQPAGAIRNRTGDHDRQPHAACLADIRDGGDRRLGVQRVEDRLDEQHIGAALDQAVDLFGVGHAQFVERHRAEARIGHIRRHRRGAVGRPERTGHETRPAVFALRDIGCIAREPRALDVELVRELGHAVVGLRNAGRRERVGRDDVGAGAEIRQMDGAHRTRLAQHQEIVVAAHLAIPGIEARAAITFLVQLERLDHGAHRAVEHQDALANQRAAEMEFCRRGHQAASFTFGRRPSKWQTA